MDAEELGFNTRIRVVWRTKWVVILFSVTMEIRISRLLQSERSTLDILMMPLSSTRGPGTVGVRGITWIHQPSSSQRSPVARAAVHNADDDPTMNLATPSSVTGSTDNDDAIDTIAIEHHHHRLPLADDTDPRPSDCKRPQWRPPLP